jgi:hypothetical protein
MMTYTLNGYYKYANSTSARAEVYSNNDTATALLARHLQTGVCEINVSDCIDTQTLTLPMPNFLMPILDSKISAADKRVVITGIDSYLSLIGDKDRKAFMTALHSRIDDDKMNVVYLISKNKFDSSSFTNPKYENSLQIVHIGSEGQYLTEPSISVVSNKWVKQQGNPTDWHSLLKTLGQFEPTGDYTVVLYNGTKIQAGLSENVAQITDIVSIAQRFYGLPSSLGEAVLEKLVVDCRKDNIAVRNLLESRFGIENATTRLALKRLFELRNDELWSAYVWYVKQVIDNDSYLAKVLSDSITSDSLLRCYVCSAAIEFINDENAVTYVKERVAAIKELGDETASLINEFISSVKSQSDNIVAHWLNCGTQAENIEIVRRVAKSDLTVGLPQLWRNSYPLLTDYLSEEYDYGNSNMNAYFRDYRRLKVVDTVSEEFVKRAYDTVLSNSFILRDSVIQELSVDTSAALLVVDGMGAEYYPLLLSLAKRHFLNVESATVAAVRLPSSTEYNEIDWNKDRLLDSVRGVDNVSHSGAEKFESNTPEQNIVATLSKFEAVIKRIVDALTKYKRVVVSADHGSSRLVVIAQEEELNRTLPWKGEPTSCRYSIAPMNEQRPPEVESYYDADNNITYWVVRGYNRLPKKGAMSVHGGATLEERLVPIIVFTGPKTVQETKPIGKKSVEQLVEKIGFDDI